MYRRLFALAIPVVLLISACKPQAPSFLPVTGASSVSAPAQVEQARTQVLAYVLDSARLVDLPTDADWKLEANEKSDDEYDYRSGDWLIMIWLPDSSYRHQRVIILNQVQHASWIGYVTPEGDVVDTTYAR
jgi:hypothetical protein